MKNLENGIEKIFKVEILSRKDLLKQGFEDSKDKNEFINLMAGKTLTVKEVINSKLCVSEEFPEHVIYGIAIKRIITPGSINFSKPPSFSIIREAFKFKTEKNSFKLYSAEYVRRYFKSGIKKIEKIISEDSRYDAICFESLSL